MTTLRKCLFCGKEFIAKSNRQKYCKGPHYRNCPICGKEYIEDNVENLKRPPVACSYECRAKKTRQTSLIRYNTKAPGNNPEARKKASETMMKNLGVPYAMMSEKVQEKAKETNNAKYGCDNAGSSPQIIAKRMQTNKERYGDVMPFNRPQCYEKQHQTMLRRYGYNSYLATPEFTESHNRDRISKTNQEFSNRLQSNHINHELEYRIDIPGGTYYIYDFYIPETNTLVEINPSISHSSQKTARFEGIPKDYHQRKTQFAREQGYNCVNIWDHDKYYKVLDIIAPPLVRIYARQCRIFKLHESVGKRFIDQYDIYGNCRGQVLFLGLVYQGDLVQVMSFKKAPARCHYDVQIARICSKPRYQIVGGVSRLLHFAVYGFDLYSIVVYNDLSKFSGHVFEKIGMKLDHINPPQLIWSKDDKYIADSMRYLYHKTKEDMISESYLPVYNCGTSVYVI